MFIENIQPIFYTFTGANRIETNMIQKSVWIFNELIIIFEFDFSKSSEKYKIWLVFWWKSDE